MIAFGCVAFRSWHTAHISHQPLFFFKKNLLFVTITPAILAGCLAFFIWGNHQERWQVVICTAKPSELEYGINSTLICPLIIGDPGCRWLYLRSTYASMQENNPIAHIDSHLALNQDINSGPTPSYGHRIGGRLFSAKSEHEHHQKEVWTPIQFYCSTEWGYELE